LPIAHPFFPSIRGKSSVVQMGRDQERRKTPQSLEASSSFFVYTVTMRKTLHTQEREKKPTHSVGVSLGIWFAILCWGGAYVAARFLLHPENPSTPAMSPLILATVRFSIASLFFVIPLIRAIKRDAITGRQIGLMILLGQLSFSLYFWFQYVGIQQTNASISSILGVGLIPTVTAFLARILGTERLKISFYGALCLGFLGVAIIVFQQPFRVSLQSGFLLGTLCLIGNTFFFALYSNLSKRWMRDISPVVMTGGTMISGTIGLFFLSFLDPAHNQWSQVTLLDGTQWIALLFLAVGCSVLAYFAYNVALSKMDASRVAVYIYFEPVITVLLSIVFLGERITWQILAGTVVIGASVIIVNRTG
jgi:drug/metabolite transporter (DMT)-like permease